MCSAPPAVPVWLVWGWYGSLAVHFVASLAGVTRCMGATPVRVAVCRARDGAKPRRCGRQPILLPGVADSWSSDVASLSFPPPPGAVLASGGSAFRCAPPGCAGCSAAGQMVGGCFCGLRGLWCVDGRTPCECGDKLWRATCRGGSLATGDRGRWCPVSLPQSPPPRGLGDWIPQLLCRRKASRTQRVSLECQCQCSPFKSPRLSTPT